LNNAQRAPRISSELMKRTARSEIRRATNASTSLRSQAEYFELLIVAEAR